MLGVNVGNYKVVGKIGQGGMGEVYRAVHRTLDRTAAVKVLLPTISRRPDMTARLLDEARSATAARHPGVVEIYDFGFLPGPTPYLLMEYLHGSSLAEQLRRTPVVPVGCGLQIARSVARALHAVHEQGIVHRDLKPGNIFLVSSPRVPSHARIKLLDFGLATLGAGPTAPTLACANAVMGTPPYMAPEQYRDADAVDRRADLYALGCVLYELVCGRPPFVGTDVADVITQHLYLPPVPPRTYDPQLPAALDDLILWLLDKDRRQRPATAAEVVDLIDDLDMSDIAELPVGPRRHPVEPYSAATFDAAPLTQPAAGLTLTSEISVPAVRRLVTRRDERRRWPRAS